PLLRPKARIVNQPAGRILLSGLNFRGHSRFTTTPGGQLVFVALLVGQAVMDDALGSRHRLSRANFGEEG
ncbi:MAG: hypothetical protein J2P46_01210, partial [Zavarzinella sp.]|nr:hypothetical protein [Zavarzinella sp.]